MKSDEYLFDLLKAIAGKDREAADVAICNLRIELVKAGKMPNVTHSASMADHIDNGGVLHHLWMHHFFEFKHMELLDE